MGDTHSLVEALRQRQERVQDREKALAGVAAAQQRVGEADRAIALLDQTIAALAQAIAASPYPAAGALHSQVISTDGENLVVGDHPGFTRPSDYLLWLLEQPGIFEVRLAATQFYGVNSRENRQKISRALNHLKDAGKIRHRGTHGWEVVK